MQTLRKKTSPCKYRNDPGRFFGDGVTFKAKLIGILEVGEARGDRMCQEALQDLKMAIRAAGEHKQRITIHVTIDGLRLRDEKTSDSLYHHPVHKISFIAQDMSDSRAFGYIFGSPDSGHRFFGIKTDKAASQVVLAMRDLFQVVFELKKKEIELARQHIQSKTIHEHQPVTLSVKSSTKDSSSPPYINKLSTHEPTSSSKAMHKELSPESVADLVDLEQELSSIQRGITQMERITPNEPTATGNKNASEEDPFGDSFTHFPTYNLLPPPESSKSRHSKPLKPPEETKSTTQSTTTTSSNTTLSATSTITKSTVCEDWLTAATSTNSVIPFVDESKSTKEDNLASLSDGNGHQNNGHQSDNQSSSVLYMDAFTDLDPLGTGKSKPYIDKKYFFQDLKNPPKKVLKDLSEGESVFSANFPSLGSSRVDEDAKGPSEEEIRMFESSNATIEMSSKLSTISTKNEFKGCEFPNNLKSDQIYPSNASQSKFKMELGDKPPAQIQQKTEDPTIIGNNKALLVTDNDPFSPRMKKFDPFDDDFSKTAMDPFEFSFATKSQQKSTTILPDTKIVSDDLPPIHIDKKITEFNGPLQVNLPPESYSAYMSQKCIERHHSDASDSQSSTARTRPSVFKQNTVDVINSISSKKMKPHLFSQKYSKRDSNSINMRRLQESDSLSENETAPEPPPRPDSQSHIEPPPLPPKKQFSDIVIRPRVTSPLALSRNDSGTRYDYVGSTTAKSKNSHSLDSTSPALPLPSRKIGRSDSNFPGPGRPAKKSGANSGKDEDDYLQPISLSNELPILLPPPQAKSSTKNRGRRQPEPTATATKPEQRKKDLEISLPDITLSQLLTLGIDELANKLNVPANKLSTMNIVELTQYLSEFIEKSSVKSIPIETPPTSASHKYPQHEAAIFKVSFDDESNDATFIAKFDDNFGEEDNSFVPNFDQFNDIKPEDASKSVDRYAVFREIMEQELKSEDDEEPPNDLTSSFGSCEEPNSDNDSMDEAAATTAAPPIDQVATSNLPKIDTKITQVISQAKDRYAALRDIILVEDLFDKTQLPQSSSLIYDDQKQEDADRRGTIDGEAVGGDSDNQKEDTPEEELQSSPEINVSMDMCQDDSGGSTNYLKPSSEQQTLTVTGASSNKDDLEIDEYMNRAISNLSLDSRDHLSPISKSPIVGSMLQNASTSPIRQNTLSVDSAKTTLLNDMSTSPIPIQPSTSSSQLKSPIIQRSPKSPIIDLSHQLLNVSRSPIPQGVSNLLEAHVGSLTDVVASSSPENDKIAEQSQPLTAESWAVFETPIEQQLSAVKEIATTARSPREAKDIIPESPCSSDDKNDWKTQQEYNKRWPRQHTSSSSRDLSPWDDDGPPASDYRRRGLQQQQQPPQQPDRHGFYMRHARRMNSGDDDYEYEDEMNAEMVKRHRDQRRSTKLHQHGGRSSRGETFDDAQSWYHPSNHHNWSPAEEDENVGGGPVGNRSFERSSYERSTYGPPYEKRGTEPTSMPPYDRKEYKNYDKRKYYRDYARPTYNFDGGYDGAGPDAKDRSKISYYDDYEQRVKGRKDYDDMFEQGFSREAAGRGSHKLDYFYDRDKRSFDRESMESYESAGRRRRSFGSGDMYGSLDSREDYRERYTSTEKMRSARKPQKQRSHEDYEQDSDGDIVVRRGAGSAGPGDSKSLQRPSQGSRPRKSSGSSPWDGEDLTPTSSQKSWKRPASASETERRLAENRRVITHTLPAGSDGEKDRRFRKKIRSRGKEPIDVRQNYATMRHPPTHRPGEFGSYEPADYEDGSYRSSSRRKQLTLDATRTMIADRRKKDAFELDRNMEGMHKFSKSSRDVYYQGGAGGYDDEDDAAPKSSRSLTSGGSGPSSMRRPADYENYDTYNETPRSNNTTNSNKFNFDDEQGFESDFNSPSTNPITNNGKSLRFSNDFSDKESPRQQPSLKSAKVESITPTTPAAAPASAPAQKLRFDDNIIVSNFDSNADLFEDDDFSKAEFSFENEDQWVSQLPKKNNLKMSAKQRQEHIKKSESVNIFNKKTDDPFEDDDFFKETSPEKGSSNNGKNGGSNFKWEKNFAKFDENI